MKVVIIDDDINFAYKLKNYLIKFNTISFDIEVNNYDKEFELYFLDIDMPDMDGITATENIRKKNPAIQVVILSVQSDANYMRRAMLVGARDFLTKPPMIDELTSAIRRAGAMAHDERQKSASGFTTIPGPNGTPVSTPMIGKKGKNCW